MTDKITIAPARLLITPDTVEFLHENRTRNDRQWYQDNKEAYRSLVLAPLAALVEALAPVIEQIDPRLITIPKVDKTISRIYRDTRFSKDKSLYREVMWLAFMKSRRPFGVSAGFFFEFSPWGYRYGCGYYQTPPATMAALRELILARDKSFVQAQRALAKLPGFALEGERYKRSRHPQASEAERQWLDRKSLCVLYNSLDLSEVFAPTLSQRLAEDFLALRPVYEFFCRGEALAAQKASQQES